MPVFYVPPSIYESICTYVYDTHTHIHEWNREAMSKAIRSHTLLHRHIQNGALDEETVVSCLHFLLRSRHHDGDGDGDSHNDIWNPSHHDGDGDGDGEDLMPQSYFDPRDLNRLRLAPLSSKEIGIFGKPYESS